MSSNGIDIINEYLFFQMIQKAKKLEKISQRKMIRMGKAGESDRHIPTLRPKHLFTGKRGIGKTDRR